MKRSNAEIVQEYGPLPGVEHVAGVTYDGRQVWFAAGEQLCVLDPASGRAQPALEVPAHAGTAFDGKHIFQVDGDSIHKLDPATGRVLSTIAAPASLSVRSGDKVQPTITISAVGGNFSNAVSLSCSGLPSGASCSFSPSSVVPGATSATARPTCSRCATERSPAFASTSTSTPRSADPGRVSYRP